MFSGDWSNGNGNDALGQAGHYNVLRWVDDKDGLPGSVQVGTYPSLTVNGYVAMMDLDRQLDVESGGSKYGVLMSSKGYAAPDWGKGRMTSDRYVLGGVYYVNGEPTVAQKGVTTTVYGPAQVRNTWVHTMLQYERVWVARPHAENIRGRDDGLVKHMGTHKDIVHTVPVPLTFVPARMDAWEKLNKDAQKDGDAVFLGIVLKTASGGYMSHVLLARPYPQMVRRGAKLSCRTTKKKKKSMGL